MITFESWVESQGFKLEEQPEAKPATNEGSAKRAALRSHAYPDAYGRAQYPKGYFAPIAADNLAYNKDAE